MGNPFAALALSFGTGLLGGVVAGKIQQDEEQKDFLTQIAIKNPGLFAVPEFGKALGRYYGKDTIAALGQFAQVSAQKEQVMQDLLLGAGGQPGAPGQAGGGGQTLSELPPGLSLSGKVGGLTVRRSGLEPPGLGPDVNAQLRSLGFDPRTASPDQIQQALQARNTSQAALTGAQESARIQAQTNPTAIVGQATKAATIASARARALLARDIQAAQASQAGAVSGSQEAGRQGVLLSPGVVQGQTTREAALTGARVGATQATQFMTPNQASQLGLPFGQTQDQAARQGVLAVSPAQREKMAALAPAQTALETIASLSEAINTFSAKERLLKAPLNRLAVLTQSDPKAVALANSTPQLRLLLRAFGEGARLSDQDVEQMQQAAPKVTDSLAVARVKLQNLKSLVTSIVQARTQNLGPIRATPQGQVLRGQPVAVQPPPLPAGISKASDAVKFYQSQGFSPEQSQNIVRDLLQGGQ